MTNNKRIGQIVRERIKDSGFSVKEIAKQVGCSRATLYRNIASNNFDKHQLEHLSNILHINLFEILADCSDI